MNKYSWIGRTIITATIFAFLVGPIFGGPPTQGVFAATQAAGKTRFVPITVGDIMISNTNVVSTGDCCNGIQFPDGAQSGGSITFPLPEDYILGTSLTLDLFFIPVTQGTGNVEFFVRWVGLSEGGWSGTGGSVTSTPVPVAAIDFVHRQSFTLPAPGTPMPQIMELTIRRNNAPTDTYTGTVYLIGLRLMYQSSWSTSYLSSIQKP